MTTIKHYPIHTLTEDQQQIASILGTVFEAMGERPDVFAPIARMVMTLVTGTINVHTAHFQADTALVDLGLARFERMGANVATAYAGRDYDPSTGEYRVPRMAALAILDSEPFKPQRYPAPPAPAPSVPAEQPTSGPSSPAPTAGADEEE